MVDDLPIFDIPLRINMSTSMVFWDNDVFTQPVMANLFSFYRGYVFFRNETSSLNFYFRVPNGWGFFVSFRARRSLAI